MPTEDILSTLRAITNRFSALAGYVSLEFYKLPSRLQAEIAQTITELVEKAMRPQILHYIQLPVRLRDGTIIQGQSAFDRMVREDKDVLALIEKYKPSQLRYINMARKNKRYILWSSELFAANLALFLQENGLEVSTEAYAYLWRTCQRFRARIYDER